MTLLVPAHRPIQAEYIAAAQQHGYQNAISRWPHPPYPVTERDRTGKHDDVRYCPEPAPERQPRPDNQRPRISARRKKMPEAA